VILFFLAYMAFFLSLYVLPFFHPTQHFKHGMEPEPLIRNKAMDVIAILLATGLFAWLERRRLRDYGLPLREAFGLRFWGGSVLGFGGIALFIGVLTVTGHATPGPQLLHGAAIVRYAWLWGVGFLLISVSEEMLMRGYMLATLTRGIGFWPSAVVTSLFFALIHLGNPGENAFGLFQVFVFGMVAALMLRRTGSLWLPIGYHAFWDWGQSYFFGVADSGLLVGGTLFRTKIAGPALLTGGSAGPEGSVLTFLILVATGWWVIAIWKPAAPAAETKAEAVVLRPDEGADPCHDEISSS
jgi:membrane protease YdiL (CAAX protease family)